jgi:general L-amino acid transport system substrate-binding protein
MRNVLSRSMAAVAVLTLCTASAVAQTAATAPSAAMALPTTPEGMGILPPAALPIPSPRPPTGPVIDAVRASRRLECGTVTAADDWNKTDLHGDLSALGGEICRAVAIAILGDTAGLTIHAFPGEAEALTDLRSGSIEVATTLSPGTTTAAQYGVGFGPPIFYDTQRFLVSHLSNVRRLEDLRDHLICAQDMTQAERTLRDELAARGIPYALMAHSEQGEMDAAVAVRHCSAAADMESRLVQSRAGFHALVSDFDFLPDRFGLEPVAPAYRYGDQIFGMAVDWTVYSLIEAEALGVTKANVAEAARREDVRTQRLMGGDDATARALGLSRQLR